MSSLMLIFVAKPPKNGFPSVTFGMADNQIYIRHDNLYSFVLIEVKSFNFCMISSGTRHKYKQVFMCKQKWWQSSYWRGFHFHSYCVLGWPDCSGCSGRFIRFHLEWHEDDGNVKMSIIEIWMMRHFDNRRKKNRIEDGKWDTVAF